MVAEEPRAPMVQDESLAGLMRSGAQIFESAADQDEGEFQRVFEEQVYSSCAGAGDETESFAESSAGELGDATGEAKQEVQAPEQNVPARPKNIMDMLMRRSTAAAVPAQGAPGATGTVSTAAAVPAQGAPGATGRASTRRAASGRQAKRARETTRPGREAGERGAKSQCKPTGQEQRDQGGGVQTAVEGALGVPCGVVPPGELPRQELVEQDEKGEEGEKDKAGQAKKSKRCKKVKKAKKAKKTTKAKRAKKVQQCEQAEQECDGGQKLAEQDEQGQGCKKDEAGQAKKARKVKKAKKAKAGKTAKKAKKAKKDQQAQQVQQVEQVEQAEHGVETEQERGGLTAKALANQETTVETEMPDIVQLLRCSRCREQVSHCRVQLCGKSLGVVRCNACNTKAVQLSRLPSWSSFAVKLRDLSDEDKAAFWKGTHFATSPEQLAQFVKEQESVVTRHTERVSATVSGEYLPLGVWSQRGFDADRIAKFCRDTREDPVLGTLYRVAIQSKAEQAEDERSREVRRSKGSTDLPGMASRAADPSVPEPAQEKKEKEVSLKVLQSLANRILGRLNMVLPSLQISLRAKATVDLPQLVVSNAQQVLDEMQQLEVMCKKTLRGQPVLETNMADANALVKKAQVQNNLLTTMLAAMKAVSSTSSGSTGRR